MAERERGRGRAPPPQPSSSGRSQSRSRSRERDYSQRSYDQHGRGGHHERDDSAHSGYYRERQPPAPQPSSSSGYSGGRAQGGSFNDPPPPRRRDFDDCASVDSGRKRGREEYEGGQPALVDDRLRRGPDRGQQSFAESGPPGSFNQPYRGRGAGDEQRGSFGSERESRRGGDDRSGYRGGRGGYEGPRGGGGGSFGDDRDRSRENSSRRSFENDDRGGGGGSGRGGRGGFSRSGSFNESFNRNPPQPARTEIKEIQVYTNFIELVSAPKWTLYQYHVDFEPTIESQRLRAALMSQHNEMFDNAKAFDGMTLYSVKKLPSEITEVQSKRNYDGQIIKLKIKRTGEVTPFSKESVRLLNIVFKRCLLNCGYTEFGRDRAYFNFNERDLHHIAAMGLKVASGYKTAMDVFSGDRILLCSELCHKLINFKTIADLMNDIYRDERQDPHRWRERCIREIVGQNVMTNYNKKTYMIDDINFDMHPRDEFDLKNGEKISFVNYYHKQYQLTVRDPDWQVMLLSLPKKKEVARCKEANRRPPGPVLLVPEFCVLTGPALIKPFANNFAMKKDLDSVTKLNPDRRHQMLRDLMRKIRENDQAKQELGKWRMQFDSDVLQVKATLLKTVPVYFGNKIFESTDRGWDSAIRDGHAIRPARLDQWSLFFMPRDEQLAQNFMRDLIRLATSMGFQIGRGEFIKLSDSRSIGTVYASSIRHNIQERRPKMIVCIINKNKDIYDAIKRTCCIEFGVPSQCVTSSILASPKQAKVLSVITKVAMQMNCKLGGELWGVRIPKNNIMIVGMDVYKDSSQRNKSVAAFIASINGTREDKLNCTRYYSKCQIEPKESVFSTGLKGFMAGALAKYREENNTLPGNIFIYRDGVSDGQFNMVTQLEIPQIRSAFPELDRDYNPKLTFLVVKKRGNTRLFQAGGQTGFMNPPIGTVVDNTIVKEKKEFFLVSQSTNQGTVSPTHFHVLEDDENLAPERLQTLSYMLTHLYYNWPGQLRVPAPCHYAHKLASLVGESLHEPHEAKLDDKLFYL